MADILSQEEIDALLEIDYGGVEANQIYKHKDGCLYEVIQTSSYTINEFVNDELNIYHNPKVVIYREKDSNYSNIYIRTLNHFLKSFERMY